MPQLSFVTLDVFTQTRYAGNPLAVVRVPKGQDVSSEQMQIIAREFNLSETLFLHESEIGSDGVEGWRVRIFLTNREVPFAGHPTIGAAVYALGTLANNASQGRLLAKAGPIHLTFSNGIAKASIPHNFHQHTQYPFTIDDLHALQQGLRGTNLKQEAVTVASPVKGMNFVNVELPDLAALAKIDLSPKPAPKLDDDWNEGFAGSYFYVVTSDAGDKVSLRSRMIEGRFEDPATGSAACGLTSYLALRRASHRVTHFAITQAVEMGRQSDIEVTVTLDESLKSVEKVELGGSAVKVMEGVVEY